MALTILHSDPIAPGDVVAYSITRPTNVTGVRLAATVDTVTVTATLTCTYVASPESWTLDIGGAGVAVTEDAEVTLHTAAGKHVTAYVDFSALPGSTQTDSIVITKNDVSTSQVYSEMYLSDGNRGTMWRGSSSSKDYSLIVTCGAAADAFIIRRADGLAGMDLDLRKSADGETFSAVTGCSAYTNLAAATDCADDKHRDLMWGGLWASPITSAYYRVRIVDCGGEPWCAGISTPAKWTPSADPGECKITFLGAANIWTSDNGQPYTWARRDVREQWDVTFPRLSWNTDGTTLETLVTGARRCWIWDSDGTRTKPQYTSGLLRDCVLTNPDVQFSPRSPMSYDRVSAAFTFVEVV